MKDDLILEVLEHVGDEEGDQGDVDAVSQQLIFLPLRRLLGEVKFRGKSEQIGDLSCGNEFRLFNLNFESNSLGEKNRKISV